MDLSALRGRTVVTTRAADEADAVAELLASHGARVLAAPMVGFAPPADAQARHWERACAHMADISMLVLTSPRAVAAVAPHAPSGMAAAALGHRTHAAAVAAGLRVLTPASLGDVHALVEHITQQMNVRGQTLLWPTSNVAHPDPAPLLAAGAHAVNVVVAYVTQPATAAPAEVLQALARQEVDAVVCMSPSAVGAWCSCVPVAWTRPLVRAAPGATTAAAWAAAGLAAQAVALQPTPEGIAKALAGAWGAA